MAAADLLDRRHAHPELRRRVVDADVEVLRQLLVPQRPRVRLKLRLVLLRDRDHDAVCVRRRLNVRHDAGGRLEHLHVRRSKRVPLLEAAHAVGGALRVGFDAHVHAPLDHHVPYVVDRLVAVRPVHHHLIFLEVALLHIFAEIEALCGGDVLEEVDALAELGDLLHLLLAPVVCAHLQRRLAALPRLAGTCLGGGNLDSRGVAGDEAERGVHVGAREGGDEDLVGDGNACVLHLRVRG
mmetsp:Transcript_10337/g.24447  ORF Transcript_10337/g.24447 Transcript_10337/m.24447 type:complete len:239 (+) Transcript_10337:293-1009(+)